MNISRIAIWLGTATMVAATAVILIFAPFELSLAVLVAYFTWRVARIGLFIWFVKWIERRRQAASLAAAG